MKGRVNWKDRLGFILASAGATIGFGNIWRFPYLVGQNGGGAFLLLFLICVFIFGIPLIITEVVIGRRGATNTVDAFKIKGASKMWTTIGYLALIGSFLILAYYIVLSGWVIGYLYFLFSGSLKISPLYSSEYFIEFFQSFVSHPVYPLLFTFVFLIMNYLILVYGIKEGIERVSRILMPLIIIIMLIVTLRSLTLPNAILGIKFYLVPDLSKITFSTLLLAVGQVFFAFSIGFGVMITLSSYLGRDISIVNSSLWIVIFNVFTAFLAGFMIFPAIFSFSLSPAAGTALIFNVLPVVFSNMFLGQIFAILFFLILLIATITTSITIFEVMITFLVEKFKLKRKVATFLSLSFVFIFGSFPSSLSYGIWANFKFLGKNFFEFFDYISANIFFITTAFLSCLFLAYKIGFKGAMKELYAHKEMERPSLWARVWFLSIKYFIPILLIIIFINNL